MKLHRLELIGVPEEASAEIHPNGCRATVRLIAELAVDVYYAELERAAHSGRDGIANLLTDAFELLRSGAKVAIDEWAEKNSAQGTAISVSRPEKAEAPLTAAVRFTAQVCAFTGVQDFTRDVSAQLVYEMRNRRGSLFG